MDRERSAFYLGLGLLVAGIALLMIVLSSALSLAANPGAFVDTQIGAPEEAPPRAMFAWSASDRDVSFTDLSSAASGAIASWEWDFGDGGTSSAANPTHLYATDGNYTVRLVVRDQNGRQSLALTRVRVVAGGGDGGMSEGTPNIDLGLGTLPKAIATILLTTGMYIVAFLVGGTLVKAGWNLIRPRPETIRIRIRPKELEQGATAEVVPVGSPPPPTE